MPLNRKLVEAAKNGDQKPIHEYLIKKGNINDLDEEGKGGLLHYAMEFHQNELAKFLLTNGADPSLRNKYEPAAKLFATTPFHKAAASGNIDGMKILMGYKVVVDVRDFNNATPLHSAIRGGKIESVKFLIANGADVNVRNNGGYTPMHGVCSYEIDPQIRIDIAQYLIQIGKVDLNAKIKVTLGTVDHFYNLLECAMLYDQYQIVALIEAKQRSDAQIYHTIQSQLLQTLEHLTKKITTLENRIDQISLSESKSQKADSKEIKEDGSFFGFTPQKNG